MNPDTATKRKIVLAGGSGFLGRELAAVLEERGDEAVILTRNPDRYRGPGRAVVWDGKTLNETWVRELNGADAIVNLAGKNVNCRPGAANRASILKSRIDPVTAIGKALREVAKAPPVWIQASSLAIYGDAGDRVCDESAHVASGYPANVCTDWEAELGRALIPGSRWAVLRISFVLGKNDGALPLLNRMVKWGLGGSIGSGKQWISWIHLDDMLAIFLDSLENPQFEGIYNVTAPHPETNADFMRTLREVRGRPWSPPAPAFAVRIGAPLLGSDPEIALTGRRCVPARLLHEGFDFQYPDLEPALREIFQT